MRWIIPAFVISVCVCVAAVFLAVAVYFILGMCAILLSL